MPIVKQAGHIRLIDVADERFNDTFPAPVEYRGINRYQFPMRPEDAARYALDHLARLIKEAKAYVV